MASPFHIPPWGATLCNSQSIACEGKLTYSTGSSRNLKHNYNKFKTYSQRIIVSQKRYDVKISEVLFKTNSEIFKILYFLRWKKARIYVGGWFLHQLKITTKHFHSTVKWLLHRSPELKMKKDEKRVTRSRYLAQW